MDDREAQAVEAVDREQHRSAYGATMRTVTCAASARSAGAMLGVSGGTSPWTDADRGIGPDADGQREDEEEQLRAPAATVRNP